MTARSTDQRTATTQVPGEDPRVIRSRAIILAAARAHFLTNGYIGANIDLIATEAGVSKRTIYNVFGGKEQLFRAMLDEAIDTAEHFSRDLASELAVGTDITDDLERIAVQLARAVLGGRIVPLRRLLIGEAERFPEIARDYYTRAPGRVMNTLAERFATLMEHGQLRIADPHTAAEHFAFLVMGAPLDRALFRIGEEQAQERVEESARAGAAAFLRAYATSS